MYFIVKISINHPVIKKYFQIIRWPNLLMLGGIQALIYFRLLDPEQTTLPLPLFIELSLITIILAAGGYVINDFYDRDIDTINKPHKLVVGKHLSPAKVKMLYLILVILGQILSVHLASRLGLMRYLFIYPIAAGGLLYYSYALKCTPVIGNLWVSFFCAGAVIIVALPDLFLQRSQYINAELWYYGAFAFLTTWYREVVKDIEDKEGDEKSNCITAVVKFGLKAGKIITTMLGLILIASLVLWDSTQTNQWIKLGLNVLQGFTVASMAFVWWAKDNSYYHHASNVIKLVMIGGTALLLF